MYISGLIFTLSKAGMFDFGETDLRKRPLHLCLSTLEESCETHPETKHTPETDL